ncbi:MAG: UbiD family decarboxylase [Chloroflexi bacterium]|nr:UbiD family decarboxylase [Chloroflexota bacterium]
MSEHSAGFPFRSMGEWAAFLEEQGQLRRNQREMDLKSDFGYVAKRIADVGGPAIIHENLAGYPGWRTFSEGLTTPQRQAWAAGVSAKNLVPSIAKVLGSGKVVKPEVVPDGPCKEVKVFGDDIDLTDLPIPYSGMYENPPYISAGISVINDLNSDWYNIAIRRFELKGKRKITEFIQMNQHEGLIFRNYVWAKKPMPIAIVIGADPLFYLLSLSPAPNDFSEWDYWGAFTGEPLQVVRCETNDLLVPATAEIVIEGIIDPDERELEGPFSEFPGYYSGCYYTPIVQVKAVTMRRNPLYYYLYMGREPSEGHNMGHLMISANILDQVRALVPAVKDVNVISTWAFTTAVSVDKKALRTGLVEKVAMAMKGVKAGMGVKNLLVFDDSVDIRNLNEMLWAFSVKFQPARDITVFQKTISTPLDPSIPSLGHGPGASSYGIFDCTEPGPPYDEPYRRQIALPPVSEKAVEIVKELGLL